MFSYTKTALRPEWDTKRRCESKLKEISEESNLKMHISAPDGELTVLVDCNGTEQILVKAQNYFDLLDMLTAIRVYIAILKISKS